MLRFLFTLYQTITDRLDWPGLQWKTYLLSLNVSFFALEAYVTYRQYHVLTRSSPPRCLRNVLTQEDFETRQRLSRSWIVAEVWKSAYRLVVLLLLACLPVLPSLLEDYGGDEGWVNLIELFPEWFSSRIWETVAFQSIQISLFFTIAVLAWTVAMLPVSYFENCVQGFKDPQTETTTKKTPREWIRTLLKQKITTLFCWIVASWWFVPRIEEQGHDAFFESIFVGFSSVALISLIAIIFIIPFSNPRNCAVLEAGKTKVAIDGFAESFHIPLGETYLWDGTRQGNNMDILIRGTAWKTNFVICENLFEKCNTDEIVALLAREWGNWRQSLVQHIVTLVLTTIFMSLPILFVCANWVEVCQSFGFGINYPWANDAQEPIMVVVFQVLLCSGLLTPFSTLYQIFAHAASRVLEARADDFALTNGYGPHLAGALAKMKKEKDLVPMEADKLFLMVCCNGDLLLSQRLEASGWTGDEDVLGRGEKLFDHWGTA